MKKIANILFVFAFFGILLTGLLKTAFFSKDINIYENRYAYKLPAFSLSGFLDKSFQEQTDDALMDQFPLAQTAKKFFNNTSVRFKTSLIDFFLHNLAQNQYVNLGNMNIFGGDHYVYSPIYYANARNLYEHRIENINHAVAALPDVTFYVYYVEKESDINFETNEKTDVREQVLSRIQLPDAQKSVFQVDSFAQFDAEFFKTDTHWNYLGAYRGYCELLQFLMPGETPLVPTDTVLVCEEFSGNKSSTNGAEGVWTEPFYAYTFDFPQMEYRLDGAERSDYGMQNAFGLDTATYGTYYGGDHGEIVFTNPNGNGETFLFIGESYDNAILKLIASHTSTLYSVDLRNYNALMNKPFDFVTYLQENHIDKVVLMGNVDYFLSENFDIEVNE